ncbi:MAG TPA: transketolase C-terminal domain-containing protein [bacterium]|nr:transketolase C-terminal domain-containing protein [bacterium]HPN30482.1 transketolase C-terminal domain-containing protein [bacterium]
MRNAFIEQFKKEAFNNDKIILLSADIGAIVFDDFRKECPGRFINVGVSEANMIGTAAGLALNGFIPFCYTIIPFAIMRNFEQIRVDVCIQKTNVKIIGVGGGVSYSLLGPTHHSVEDIAIMRSLPNMTVIAPSDPAETKSAVSELIKFNGPAYLRLGLAGEPLIHNNKNFKYKINRAEIISKGDDLTIISAGYILNSVIQAAKKLSKSGISSEIINVSTIKPLDKKTILKSVEKTGKAVVVEEHSIIGGIGSAVSEILAEHNFERNIKFKRIGILDKYNFNYGTREYLLKINKLDASSIAKSIIKYMGF